jgi:hypothetical protein
MQKRKNMEAITIPVPPTIAPITVAWLSPERLFGRDIGHIDALIVGSREALNVKGVLGETVGFALTMVDGLSPVEFWEGELEGGKLEISTEFTAVGTTLGKSADIMSVGPDICCKTSMFTTELNSGCDTSIDRKRTRPPSPRVKPLSTIVVTSSKGKTLSIDST